MCEICGKSVGHWPRCPYYSISNINEEREETGDFCVICGGAIFVGDHILCNGDDKFHYSCFEETPKSKIIVALSLEEKFVD